MSAFPPPPDEQPSPFGAPPPEPVVVHSQSTNGFAVASLVLGIIWIFWLGSILALIFGYIAKGQINASAGAQGGRGLAIAGIVLGWVGIGMLLLVLLFGDITFTSSGDPSPSNTPLFE